MKTNCEKCMYYEFDEVYERDICGVDMDEDEFMRLMGDRSYNCPYYRSGDDYAIVKKQM